MWEKVFHPWEFINDELKARKRTQREFADIIGTPVAEVNKLIKGKTNITAELAVRIWEAFWVSAETRMNLQVGYSLEKARKKEKKRIERVHIKLKEYWFEDLSLKNKEEILEELWLNN